MTVAEALLAYTIAAALMTLTPGLDTALVLRTAAVEGARRALAAGFGICCGVLIWAIAVSIGLGALLAVSEVAYTALRWVGAAYLVYLGVQMLRSTRGGFRTGDAAPASEREDGDLVRRWFLRGLLTNLLNPKVGVFYVTFMPQFIPVDVSVTGFSLLLAAIHGAEGILWFAALILATRPLAGLLHRPGVVRALDRATGGVLILFGLKLAFEDRAG